MTVRTVTARAVVVGLLVGALTACGADGPGPAAPSPGGPEATTAASTPAAPTVDQRVDVRLEGLRGAEGARVAGVLFRGAAVDDLRWGNALGGFGTEVDSDPFSLETTVFDTSPIGNIPLLEGQPVEVEPGGYTLLMWQGPTLSPYSEWFPAEEAGATVCPVRFRVGDDEVTTVTVTGFPRQTVDNLGALRPCAR